MRALRFWLAGAVLLLVVTSAGAQLMAGKSFAVQVHTAKYPVLNCEMSFSGPSVMGSLATACAMGSGLYLEIPVSQDRSILLAAARDASGQPSWFMAMAWPGQGGQVMFEGFGRVAVYCTNGCVRDFALLSGIVSSPP